jgi:hypothetical protein
MIKSLGGRIMVEPKSEIIIGILGQWASGKSTAAKILVNYLGGKEEVIFLNDQDFLIRQAVNHIVEREYAKVKYSIEEDGRQRFESGFATVWLDPGEDLKTVDISKVRFNTYNDAVLCDWINRARVELGRQIHKRAAEGNPIVIEAAFGSNKELTNENPFGHTILELFMRLPEGGIEPQQIKWIVVEANYDKRSERNQNRQVTVPIDVFARYAADGGDLNPDQQTSLEAQGLKIKRVANDHDDIEKFRAEIIAAFEELCTGNAALETAKNG